MPAAELTAGRTRRAVWSGGLVLASFLLSLLVLEAAARLFARSGAFEPAPPSDRALWVYDATLGWFHRPSSFGHSTLSGPDRGRVRINALGLRGRELAAPRPEGVRRVLVLGDSYVFGVGTDEENIFTTHLERLLNGGGPGFEVVNLGVTGYSTDQELQLLRRLGPQLSPNLVLVVTCDNDFRANTEDFAFGRYYKPYFELDAGGRLVLRNTPVPRLSPAQRTKLWLTDHSALWSRLRSRRSDNPWVGAALGFFQAGTPRASGADAVEITFRLLEAMSRWCADAGASFITMNTGHRGEETTLFHALRPKLDAAGIAYIGAEASLGRGRRLSPGRDWDFQGDAHWNRDAHRLMARIVHAHVQTTLLAAGPGGALTGNGPE